MSGTTSAVAATTSRGSTSRRRSWSRAFPRSCSSPGARRTPATLAQEGLGEAAVEAGGAAVVEAVAVGAVVAPRSLVATGRERSGDVASDECRYCGNKGHWARECRKKKRD